MSTTRQTCPFCGGGNTRVDENTFWTGQRSKLVSVTLHHWCEPNTTDMFGRAYVKITAATREQADEVWNRNHRRKD